MDIRSLWRPLAAVPPALLIAAAPLRAQTAAPPAPASARSWTDTAQLSFVATGGNSQNRTFGFSDELKFDWTVSTLDFKAGGVRADSTTHLRYAFMDPTAPRGYTLVDTATNAATAESYYLNGRYDRKISEKFFWFAGGGWERNRFAGILDRYSALAGVGNIWVKDDRTLFKTDYALGYTRETPVLLTPGYIRSYATFRLGANYAQKIGASSNFTSDFAWTDNLRESRDWTAVSKNAFTAQMSARLALKVGLDLFYDHQPAFAAVTLYDQTLTTTLGTVPLELKKLDTVFTTSLVLTF